MPYEKPNYDIPTDPQLDDGIEYVQAGKLQKGDYCMLKGYPCKVTLSIISKHGKHGAGAITIMGVDIFTGRKFEEYSHMTSNIKVPIVELKEYSVIDVSEEDEVLTLV